MRRVLFADLRAAYRTRRARQAAGDLPRRRRQVAGQEPHDRRDAAGQRRVDRREAGLSGAAGCESGPDRFPARLRRNRGAERYHAGKPRSGRRQSISGFPASGSVPARPEFRRPRRQKRQLSGDRLCRAGRRKRRKSDGRISRPGTRLDQPQFADFLCPGRNEEGVQGGHHAKSTASNWPNWKSNKRK